MIEPSRPSKNTPVLAWCERLWDYMRSERIIAGPGLESRKTSGGHILSVASQGGAAGVAATLCHFGEIITVDGEKVIRGGIIFCGDKTWNIDPQELNLAASGVWLVSIAVTARVNRDDDHEVLLPGVETGTKPAATWTKTAWTMETDYPDGTAPVVSTGNGVIILPIGKLKIADSKATLERTGCGHFTIGHCSGSLNFSR